MAAKNARLGAEQTVGLLATQEARLSALQQALELPDSVQRIECFDVSHTMGEATVASCVVYDRSAMQKSEYRRYNIAEAAAGDDYGAMREVLTQTEDVGERFAEEARRMHYGEVAERGIRGQATREQTEALLDEGIEVMPLLLPDALKEPLQ